MLRNLIMSGGVAHDYARTSPILSNILAEVGFGSEIYEGFDVFEDGSLLGFDMLTLNCVRWTCDQTPNWRDDWHFELSGAARGGFLDFLAQGKGLLALHCATICFDDWSEYRKILGAWWDWGHSGHAPLQEHRMRVRTNAHPVLLEGMDDFVIMDELYTHPRVTDAIEPLIEADWEGTTHPILWLREYGNARVCYHALGHGVEAFEHPVFQTLIQRAARWVVKELGHNRGLPSDG